MLLFAMINAVNVVVSSLLVFGLGLGVHGIVGGTVTARCLGAVLTIAVLIRGRAFSYKFMVGIVLCVFECNIDFHFYLSRRY